MKDAIHPKYLECTITCACGESFKTRSTKPTIRVEICSKCHPFYTGKQKFLDTAGMVEKFTRKWQGDAAKKAKEAAAPTKKPEKAAPAPVPLRTSKTLQSQLPGAGPATLAPAIGQKAAQKAAHQGDSKS